MKATLIRDVLLPDPNGRADGVRITESVEVDIIFPDRIAPPRQDAVFGEWRIAVPCLIFAEAHKGSTPSDEAVERFLGDPIPEAERPRRPGGFVGRGSTEQADGATEIQAKGSK